jgi:hypothetical protein
VSAQTDYQLKLTGPGLSLDKAVPEELANQIVRFVLSGGAEALVLDGSKSASDSGAGSKSGIGNASSIGEYLSRSKARKNPQKMTAIGQYLHLQKKETFSIDDLLKGFSDAKESRPKNPHRDISSAIRSNWIALREKDAYYVTSSGTTAIQNGFPKEPRRSRKKSRRKAATAKG